MFIVGYNNDILEYPFVSRYAQRPSGANEVLVLRLAQWLTTKVLRSSEKERTIELTCIYIVRKENAVPSPLTRNRELGFGISVRK